MRVTKIVAAAIEKILCGRCVGSAYRDRRSYDPGRTAGGATTAISKTRRYRRTTFRTIRELLPDEPNAAVIEFVEST